MTAKTPLFVIEAPGKIGCLRGILDRLNLSHARIYATKGRIYDLPSKKMGVDLDNLESIQLIPLNNKVIDGLKLISSKSSHVYVMTDNDNEGELIASHVFKIVGKKVPVSRLIINSMTKEAVSDALLNPVECRNEMAKGAINRRIFDRICGYHYGVGGIGIGRILSPVLRFISTQKKPAMSEILMTQPKENGFMTLRIKVPKNTDVYKIQQTIGDNQSYDFILSNEKTVNLEKKCLTGNEALLDISRKLDASITDVSKEMQSLYESGKISYHRTDSPVLSKEAISEINRVCSRAGSVSFDTKKAEALCGPSSKYAHDGLHVTGYCQSLESEYKDLDLKGKVYRYIYRLSESYGRDLVLNKSDVILSGQIFDLLRDNSCTIEAVFGYIGEVGSRRKYPINDFPGLCPELSRGWACSYSSSRTVAESLLEMGLGRQSTFAYHSEKISKEYLTSDGEVSFRGLESMRLANMIAPLILSPERSLEAERILLTGKDTEDSIYNSFNEVGIKESYMFGKMNKGKLSVSKNLDLDI